jgi:ankyrin repeat protein
LTPLIIAASVDNLEAVIILLSAGADANAKYPLSGMTALMAAASKTTHPEMIMALLAANADAMMMDKDDKAAIDYAKENLALANTDAYRVLASLSGTAEERAFTMGEAKTGELKAPFSEIIKLEVVEGTQNIAHEFNISTTGTLNLWFEVKAPDGKEYYDDYVFAGGSTHYSDTFRQPGIYTLKLKADQGEGTFTLESEALVNTQNSGGFQGSIALGTEVSGTIATYENPIYHLNAVEGVPVVFHIASPNQPQTKFMMTAQPVGSDKGLLGVRPDQEGNLIFVPEVTATYELILFDEGASKPIEYTIVAELLEGFSQDSQEILVEGNPITGEVTTSITHVYQFEGASPSSEGARGIRISATGTAALNYSVHIAGEGNPLNELHGTISPGQSKIIRMAGSGSIGPMIGRKMFLLEAGTFEVRISSYEGAASYEVALERVP